MAAERDDNAIIHAIHTTMVYGSFIGLIPEAHRWILRLSALLARPIPTAPVQQYIKHQISLRRHAITPADKNDFLTKLLKNEDAGTATPFDTLNSCGSNIAAGSDTTAITLAAVLYHLLKSPTSLRKLRAEIERKTAEGAVSDPVTYAQAQEALPYLQAVLKEALRMHPAVGQPLMRVVPAGGAVVAGTWFPAGAQVGVNPWVAHRNEEVFGGMRGCLGRRGGWRRRGRRRGGGWRRISWR